MEKRSLGLIETWGFVPAVEAADAGAKAANVVFLGYEKVQAGLITIRFLGDVGAVKAAVAAGAAAAEKVGQVVAVHVIPRPDAQIPKGPPGEPPSTIRKEKEPPPEPLPPKEKEVEAAAEPPAPAEEKKVEPAPGEAPPPPVKKRKTPMKTKPRKRKTTKS